MINWDKTTSQYNISNLNSYRPRVVVNCDKCGIESSIVIRIKSEVIDNQLRWECPSCVGKRPEVSQKLSKSTKSRWSNDEYRIQRQNSSLELLNNIEFKNKHLESIKSEKLPRTSCCFDNIVQKVKLKWNNPEYTDKLGKSTNSPDYKEKIIASNKRMWSNPVIREQLLKSLRSDGCKARIASSRINQSGKISSIQKLLYSILDDLNVKYFKENEEQCVIGPWSFDCVIPRGGKPTLLIECQGEYWHSINGRKNRDQSKASYISNNFIDKYELKAIWEHEFLNKDKIVELLKYWLGITKLEVIDFDFDDIVIKQCPAKDYKLLLSKYHYLANAGRGGIAYGAYLGNELIAVSVFSPLVRQNLPYSKDSTRELSRLCIHPKYQKKNFASWFISKSIESLPTKYNIIVSYCDTTFNHSGTVYKASNFVFDGEVYPDYWYVSKDGWVMHKKTLYNHAIKMQMTEKEYSESVGYKKVYGNKKLRFIYNRD